VVIYDRCECDTEDFYVVENKCIPKQFEVSVNYQENAVFIEFSKLISMPLGKNDISITFHEELDTRLLRYSIITIKDLKEYMIEFYTNFNIQANFEISIEFSDHITDRQNTKLKSSVYYTTLPFLVEGITARSEFCDQSCKECELLDGRVSCIECYNFAQVFEGVCKCYDEEGTDPLACPMKCPDNMRINSIKHTCVSCEECSEENLSQNSNDEKDSLSSEGVKEISKSSYSTSSSTASAVAIGSALVDDKMWSFINTIQIYSYIPLIQVNMPISLQETLKSQDGTNQYLRDIQKLFKGGQKPYSRAVEFRYETSFILRNASKQLLILIGLVGMNILIYMLNKFTRGRAEKYSGIVLRAFKYKIYLRFYIQFYMDISVVAFLQLIYVRFM
jgi:hypothetical protein